MDLSLLYGIIFSIVLVRALDQVPVSIYAEVIEGWISLYIQYTMFSECQKILACVSEHFKLNNY